MKAFIAVMLLLSTRAVGQTVPAPAGALAPWLLFGLETSLTPEQHRWLNMQSDQIARTALSSTQTFKSYAQPSTANASRMAASIIVGQPLRPELKDLVIEPVLCKIGDRLDVMLLATRISSDQLIAMVLQPVSADQYVTGTLPALPMDIMMNQLGELAQAAPVPYQNHAVQIDIRSAKPWTRIDTGHHSCLDLRLAQQMYLRWPVLNFVGRDVRSHLRQMAPATDIKPLRPSRVVLSRWERGGEAFELSYTISESVFGQRLSTATPVVVPVSLAPDGWFTDVSTNKLLADLALQQQGLALSEPPQIAKVYGAWVYLDKGRAYGLKMNDRLIVQGREKEIKGHVVGFYGPGLKLNSTRGFPVQEGAIVYIRLGQRETRIGQTLVFDPQTFPTDWPPEQRTER